MLLIPTLPKSYFPSGNRGGCPHLLPVVLICCYFLLSYAPPCLGGHKMTLSEKIKAATATSQQSHTTSATTEDSNYWFQNAEVSLQQKLVSQKTIKKKAKNVIFVIGHGMGISTITASRIFKGQKEGRTFGEEANLKMNELPNVALSKTFCQNSQVAESACASSALLCGTLANAATVGLTSNVQFGDCIGQQNKANHLTSILAAAQDRGMSTGFVVNTRVTHSVVAATYAHSANTAWENDKKVTDSGENSDLCDDTAEQLIFGDVGKRINVILGGGRNEMIPNTTLDVETNQPGHRTDGKNLIDSWLQSKNPQTAKYVWNKEQLLSVDTKKTDHLLGLFSYSNMGYVNEAESNADPSLAEMTKVAIDILSKNPSGYFLFIEGGRIDQANHENKAQKAFLEVLGLDDAILAAMTIDLQYTQMTGLPLIEETHGGEDVAVYSRGPWSHLLAGVNHESYIPHVIAYAACLDFPGKSQFKGVHCYETSSSYLNHPTFQYNP
ncbi:unnamed protein product [Orchesella dallaii]|uniref:alkaline phosphatase n=1 Tax=Orchesella dallaii TaxID=48710 RepID=A0ABP1RLB4_9HEXA